MTAKKKQARKSPRAKTPEYIKCSYSQVGHPVTLVPNPRNPNTHSERQIEILAKVIKETGFRSPIVVSKRSGYIVKGHGRLAAALKLDLDLVPIDFQVYRTEAEEWADMIADNRIAELSALDDTKLADIVAEMQEVEFDLDLTGFDSKEIDKLLGVAAAPPEFPENDENISTDQVCPKCGYKWS